MNRTAASTTSIGITRQDIANGLFWLLGFFVGRVLIFGSINPVVIAYTAPFFGKGKRFYISVLFVIAGLLTRFNPYVTIKYILCLSLLCLLNPFLKNEEETRVWVFPAKAKPHIVISAVVSVSIAVCGIAAARLNGFGLYFTLMSILEGILTFSFCLIMRIGVNALGGTNRSRRGALTNEELISLLILCGAIVAGAADIYVGLLSLKLSFCGLLVLLMAQSGGATLGAAGGLLVGLLMNLTGFEGAEFVVIMGVCGFISGSLRDIGRITVTIGFILGTSVAVFYFGTAYFTAETIVSLLAAVAMFAAIPASFTEKLHRAVNPAYDNAEKYAEKVKLITSDRLNGFSSALKKLSKTFGGLSEKKERFTQKEVTRLIDDVAAKICESCENCGVCWETNFYETYQSVFSLLSACEKKGSLELSDFPEGLRSGCIAPDALHDAVSRYFELYRANMAWHNKLIESRDMVSQQLAGVANIISRMSEELESELDFKTDLETKIINELSRRKIEVESVIVLQNKHGRYEVSITQKSNMVKDYYIKSFTPVVSTILNRRMKVSGDDFYIEGSGSRATAHMNLIEEQRFCVTCGLAKSPKGGAKESGDSYSFMELKNGQCLMALSDGMGSGKAARVESAAAIELLEEFIESGFDQDTAVKLINSALLLKSSNESFSTLDICSVDLHTGQADFIKIGAASTFLLRDGETEAIRSWSLPVGILNDIDVDTSRKRLKHGDIIIMMTDGVLDSDEHNSFKEGWVISMLKAYGGSNPQDIADYLLERANRNYRDGVKDDMTILACRFWEKM